MPNKNETQFVARLVSGERQAFKALVEENAGWMLQLAKRYTKSEATAADCVQESFLLVFRKIGDFEERSSLRSWIRSIVVSQALMKLRKSAQSDEQSLDHFIPEFDRDGLLVGPVSIANDPVEAVVSQREVSSIVRVAIAELPDSYRAVLLLRDIEGYSTRETAEALAISESAVRTRLHRGRSELKKQLLPTMSPKTLDDIL
ncbi:MAG: RNA polymerase sigma factor [Erythrobacter sp.]|uniref:RNA polymerase sigma factor n=1 Tax=Erythrobacter sp. TaxID=1042 RepID=UPI00326361E0